VKRIVVFGATGVIGTTLVKALVEKNIEVLVLVRKDSARKGVILEHPLVNVKYCSLSEIADLANDTGKKYDVFYHFAWAGASGAGRHDMYLQNDNVKYALDAVKAAQRFGCKKFVFAGSQAEYGLTNEKLTPDTATRPVMGYGFAKLCAGYMTRELAHQLGLEHIWTRVVSIYGPRDGCGTMIISAIEMLLKGEKPKLTEGGQLWDYLYSCDAARAFLLLGEKGVDGKIYVIGSGEPRPLSEYITIMRDAIDINLPIGFGEVPYGKNQVMHLCADISEITKDTGWKPQVSFEEGIKRTIDFVRENISNGE